MGFFKRKDPQPAVGISDIVDGLVDAGVLQEEPEPLPEPHPLHSLNYEPVFPRTSVTRRVLGHITDEVDKTELGPRNSLKAITAGVIADPHTEIHHAEQVQPYLDAIVDSGLATFHAGVYTVTEAGWRELMN
jgi:hypothetical protein